MLTVSEKIRIIARREGVTMTELAERTGQTVQNLNNKLRRNNFTIGQIEAIGEALNCGIEVEFISRDGSGVV